MNWQEFSSLISWAYIWVFVLFILTLIIFTRKRKKEK